MWDWVESKTADGKVLGRGADYLVDKYKFIKFNMRSTEGAFDAISTKTKVIRRGDPKLCVKNLAIFDHGYTDGYQQINDRKGFSEQEVKQICDSLCEKSTVYMLSCSAGRLTGSAQYLLEKCSKIERVYACRALNYGICNQDNSGGCPSGEFVELVRNATGEVQLNLLPKKNWSDVLPKP